MRPVLELSPKLLSLVLDLLRQGLLFRSPLSCLVNKLMPRSVYYDADYMVH